jgi:hypothetical protein
MASKRLKEIDFDKLTLGTEVYSMWNKKLIGKVINTSGTNWRNHTARIIEIVPPDYCECCKRGNKQSTEVYHSINLSQLRYKEYQQLKQTKNGTP